MWVWWVDPPEDLVPRLSGEGEKTGFFFFFLSVVLCGWWSGEGEGKIGFCVGGL